MLLSPMGPPDVTASHALNRQRFDVYLAALGSLLIAVLMLWLSVEPSMLLPVVACGVLAFVIALAGWAGLLARPPAALAIGFFVLGYSMTDFTVRHGGVNPGGFDLQSLLKGGIWALVLVFGLVHGARHLRFDAPLTLLGLYAAFAFGSAFYSPALVLGIGSAVALLALATWAGFVANLDIKWHTRMWTALFMTLSLLAAISIVLYFVAPDWARDYKSAGAGRLRGLTGSGNSLGPLCSVATIAGLFAVRMAKTVRLRALYLAFLSLNLIALALSQSRSAMVGLAAAIILPVCIARPILFPFLAAGLVGGGWLMTSPEVMKSVLDVLAITVSRTGDVREVTSMTGRSDIWLAVYKLWLQSPMFGFGLASPRQLISEAPISRWQTYESAHNWLLESLLSFGVVGTSLLVAFLLVLLLRLWRLRIDSCRRPISNQSEVDWLGLCVLRCVLFALISGTTEKAFAGMPSPSTVLLAMSAASAVVCARMPFADLINRLDTAHAESLSSRAM